MYEFRRNVTQPTGRPNILDVAGAKGLAQAASIASLSIRKGITDRVEILDRQRLVLAVSRFDVRMLDEPRRHDTYHVRMLDDQHAWTCIGDAAHLRDALAVADEYLPSGSASAAVEIRRGRSSVALLTRADLGRVWPGKPKRDVDVGPAQ
ncbi:hypothetical protein ABZ890_42045 [Streptomyces sp. NPDC046984]|uniref:hypothetical protein n=1 Tax=Streptomyces sp. NPDC046984 TaxID=3155138 RepID=UPI003404EA24